jgi:hypothetical protein
MWDFRRVRVGPPSVNAVRLALSVLAYNLGNLWRRLALPKGIKNWSQEPPCDPKHISTFKQPLLRSPHA